MASEFRGQGAEVRGQNHLTSDFWLLTSECRPVVLSALLVLAGCAELTPLGPPVSLPGTSSLHVPESGYKDYTGVIHIHTKYSDGAGTFEDIARVANAQRLDYLITTDHNTLRPLHEGKQGWYGTTLVLVGTELSTRGGHYVALNVTDEIDYHKLPTQRIIDEVNRQGGLGFIAHPYYKKRRWTDWTVHGFLGIEGYNVAHDTLDENWFRLALWTLSVPAEPFYLSIIDRPYDPLRKWDELMAQRGRVVGIGGSDAHEIRVLGLKFAPYHIMFRLARTHLLIRSDTVTDLAVYEALRSGHVYFSIELDAEAKGFSFVAERGTRVVGVMGDEVVLVPDLRLTASLPAAADLTLVKDGRPIATASGQAWQVPITQPGAYRLEAMRLGKPWIFSNPIYVRSTPLPQEPQEVAK